jgi:hypothetical protein
MLSKEHLDKLMDMGAPERFVIGSELNRPGFCGGSTL